MLTPDGEVQGIVENGGVAVIEGTGKSHARHSYMWGSGGATLTRAHIDALLAGHTLTFAVEEFQVFIYMESAEQEEDAR